MWGLLVYDVWMAKGVMVNFRLREEDVARIDGAAQKLGVSRSEFIRIAVSDAISDVVGGEAVGVVGVRGKAKEKAAMMDDRCPKNSYCIFVKDASRVPTCRTCGFRRS